MFSCEFCEIVKTRFLQKNTGRLLLIIVVSIVVQGELANKTINYYTEIKSQQFEPEVRVIKRASPGEKTSLTHVFEEGFWSIVQCDCQRYIPMLTEKRSTCCQENQYLSDKFTAGRRYLNVLYLFKICFVLVFLSLSFLPNKFMLFLSWNIFFIK